MKKKKKGVIPQWGAGTYAEGGPTGNKTYDNNAVFKANEKAQGWTDAKPLPWGEEVAYNQWADSDKTKRAMDLIGSGSESNAHLTDRYPADYIERYNNPNQAPWTRDNRRKKPKFNK